MTSRVNEIPQVSEGAQATSAAGDVSQCTAWVRASGVPNRWSAKIRTMERGTPRAETLSRSIDEAANLPPARSRAPSVLWREAMAGAPPASTRVTGEEIIVRGAFDYRQSRGAAARKVTPVRPAWQ